MKKQLNFKYTKEATQLPSLMQGYKYEIMCNDSWKDSAILRVECYLHL